MTDALIQLAGRVGEGLAEDSEARSTLGRVRRAIDDLRRRLVQQSRYRGVHNRDVWLVNSLREREAELETSILGWDRLLPIFTARLA